MTRRAKTPKFKSYQLFKNCFDLKLNNLSFAKYLKSTGPYSIELGCGTARLSLELARRYPDKSFIAVDIKSDRMWRGAKTALEEGVNNVAFLRADINNLNEIFKPKSVNQIWVTFPDPYPKRGDAQRRLTNLDFLQKYTKLLISGGVIKFKSDNKPLFDWSLNQFAQTPNLTLIEKSSNLHSDYLLERDEAIKTSYEERFLSNKLKINYAKFKFIQ